MRHLLVTNDFPPKLGGIQSYLWELWRRLPPDDVCVLTTAHPDAAHWDAAQPYRVERMGQSVLVPGPALRRRVERLAAETGAELVVVDPVGPLAPLAARLDLPYAVVVHGAELVVPAYAPGVQLLVRRCLRDAALVVAAGAYPAAMARRAAGRPLPTVVVPPGVDHERFLPLDAARRAEVRTGLGLVADQPTVVSVSRLVPRKGMDTLIQAVGRAGELAGPLQLAIAGTGRDLDRLARLASSLSVDVHFLGAVPDEQLADVYGMADVFAMLCRDRWMGLEQEGFGIVFLEAAAAGVPQIAGASGGAGDAVADGQTGFVVDPPTDVEQVTERLVALIEDEGLRRQLGTAARQRAVTSFDYDVLARDLGAALAASVPATSGPSRP
ncbi:MAG: glycosyltransferase family 4 protein [Acidimicrobiia bacterium]|nr:glycosyltransferase family 4 protein [Acidimicrobiia bacterium]